MKDSNSKKPTFLIVLAVIASIFGVQLFPSEDGEKILVREKVEVPCPDVTCECETQVDSLTQLENALRYNVQSLRDRTISLKREIAKLSAGKETPDAFVAEELRKELQKLKATNKDLAQRNGELQASLMFAEASAEDLRKEVKQSKETITQKEEMIWRFMSQGKPDEYAKRDYEIPEHLMEIKPRRHYLGIRYGFSGDHLYGVGYQYRLTPNSLLGVSALSTADFQPLIMANFDVSFR